MADDPDVNRVVRKRTANRSVLKNLLNQGRDIISNTEDRKKTCNDLESLISVIENKFQITKEQDLEIVDLIHEDLIEADTTRAAEFELEVEKGKHINNFLEENRPKDKESSISTSDSLNIIRPKKLGVNLPKITIKTFSGNPMQQFYDTFKATIDNNEYLSDVEKLSYLTGLLEGQAYQSLEGFNVTKDNYKRALELLSER